MRQKTDVRKYFLLSLLLLSLAPPALAWSFGDPIVPCGVGGGAECTTCDLFKLVDNIIDFIIIGFLPVFATLMFVIGGFFILIAGANPSYYSKGKTIFANTFWGVVIVFISWLIVNTLMTSLPASSVSLGSFTFNPANWYNVSCSAGPQAPPKTPPQPGPGGPPVPGTEATCPKTGVDLCQGVASQCSNSSCSQYDGVINQNAGGVASPNLLKAIMFKESSCFIGQTSGHGAAGLMQLLPSTANQYRNRCGVTQLINAAWLTNPANASASICIAAEFIRAMSQTQCGSDPRQLAAGYNGGPAGACGASEDCAGETSCTGGPKKRWECLYNNPQHTSCNVGFDSYEQTRNYVAATYYCYNSPGF